MGRGSSRGPSSPHERGDVGPSGPDGHRALGDDVGPRSGTDVPPAHDRPVPRMPLPLSIRPGSFARQRLSEGSGVRSTPGHAASLSAIRAVYRAGESLASADVTKLHDPPTM